MMQISETIKMLLIINVLFFVGSWTLGDRAYDLFALHYFENPNFKIWQLFTHMFMHADLMHILFNMFALWMFGSPLEQKWGRNRFLFFYFSAGLGAAFIHGLVNYFQFQQAHDVLVSAGMSITDIYDLAASGTYNTRILEEVSKGTLETVFYTFNTPAVGASGAIYGILVAFAMMYPNVELMLIFLPIPIKAKYFIPVLLLIDLFSGLTGFGLFGSSIAHWAHLGGALFGYLMMRYWKKHEFDNNRWDL